MTADTGDGGEVSHEVEDALQELGIGTELVDCGDRGEVVDKSTDDAELVYTVEYPDGRRQLPHREAAIGVVDGTIRVKAP